MTIEIRGHVQSIEHAGSGHAIVRIQVEASRMPAGKLGSAPTIEVYASSAETDTYHTGMPIYIQIRPE